MHDLIVKLCHNHPQVNASLMLVIFFPISGHVFKINATKQKIHPMMTKSVKHFRNQLIKAKATLTKTSLSYDLKRMGKLIIIIAIHGKQKKLRMMKNTGNFVSAKVKLCILLNILYTSARQKYE